MPERNYKSGIAGYLDVLDAQREHYAAEQALIGTRRAALRYRRASLQGAGRHLSAALLAPKQLPAIGRGFVVSMQPDRQVFMPDLWPACLILE